jgi:CRP-like cAMP-binding protein
MLRQPLIGGTPGLENRLVQRLPSSERRQLLKSCELVELTRLTTLGQQGEALSHLYFPRSGFISLLVQLDQQGPMEVGMVGWETVLGSERVLGHAPLPWQALVQGAGDSWRIGVHALEQLLPTSPSLLRLLKKSHQVRLQQLAMAPACVRYHLIEQRLARWLLMCLDRTRGESFPVTQAFMSQMLGVRRVGVTVAAGELQARGLIEYRRGKITVLQRTGLQAQACSCYSADLRAYAELA